MASKRIAAEELNHENWDQEQEAETAGTFKWASDDVLKKRILKTAKRRSDSSNENAGKNIFSGFSAFGKTTNSKVVETNAFSFLKSSVPDVNGIPALDSTNKSQEKTKTLVPTINSDSDHYLQRLKGLNESFSGWVKKHVDENPFINLSPVFNDYKKYFDELDTQKQHNKDNQKELNKPETSDVASNSKVQTPTPIASKNTENDSVKINPFNFGNNTSITQPSFSYNFKSTDMQSGKLTSSFSDASDKTGVFGIPPVIGGSSFGKVAPFSFSAPIQTTNDMKSNNNEQKKEDDEPPKAEFTRVVEDGHVYTTRCKLFIKKDNNFTDYGVGTLYVKPLADNEKHQLIVRADTNLGNLLCNLILSENIPLKRMAKKDVMMICMPTPEFKPPPVPVLIRVKSSEMADELLKNLQKFSKK